jgi:TRAP transporter TAXI family solute receptor
MLTRRMLLIVPSVLALLTVAIVSLPAGAAEPPKLVFAGGPAGGAWYGLAGAVAELLKTRFPGAVVTVMPGGGVGNIQLVETGKAQLGLSISHLYKSGRDGTEPYKAPTKQVRAVLGIGTSDMAIFLVKKSVPLGSIAQLKEKKFPLRLTTTSKASTPALGAERLLSEYGISFDDLKAWGGSVTFTTYSDAQSLITDGHADAIIATTVPAVDELTRSVEMKWLAPEERVVESMVAKYGYAKNQIAGGKYRWAPSAGWTVGEPNIIVARADVAEDVIAALTRAICEKPETIRTWGAHHANFDPQGAWKNLGGPLHPGAERYFRSAGVLK